MERHACRSCMDRAAFNHLPVWGMVEKRAKTRTSEYILMGIISTKDCSCLQWVVIEELAIEEWDILSTLQHPYTHEFQFTVVMKFLTASAQWTIKIGTESGGKVINQSQSGNILIFDSDRSKKRECYIFTLIDLGGMFIYSDRSNNVIEFLTHSFCIPCMHMNATRHAAALPATVHYHILPGSLFILSNPFTAERFKH